MASGDSSPSPGRRGSSGPANSNTRLAIVLTLVVWAAFLLGLAGRWWWIADLFAHFRVQYAALLWVCAAVLFWRRERTFAMVALTGAVLLSATVFWYVSWPAPAEQAAGDLRFISFNKYWRNNDAARIAGYLEKSGADVIAVQETEAHGAVQDLARLLPSYPHLYATSGVRLGGAIFSRWPIISAETVTLVPGGANAIRAVVDVSGEQVTLVGVHLNWPIGARNVRLRNAELRVLAQLARRTQGPLLIIGDFNVTPWSANFYGALDDTQMRDCARGQGLAVTWPTQFAPVAIRIDQCLCSSQWEVVSVSRGPNLGSDHYPTVTDLILKEG